MRARAAAFAASVVVLGFAPAFVRPDAAANYLYDPLARLASAYRHSVSREAAAHARRDANRELEKLRLEHSLLAERLGGGGGGEDLALSLIHI